MLRPPMLLSVGLLLLLQLQSTSGITVELSEILRVGDDRTAALGEYETLSDFTLEEIFGGVDPIDADCPTAGRCIGLLTRDGSLDLDSRYACTGPLGSTPDGSGGVSPCGISYPLSPLSEETLTIASVKIALHPDSITTLKVEVDGETAVEEWEANPGSIELQEIPGLEGLEAGEVAITGIMEQGEYLAILEVEIYVTVDEVPVVGTSASTRTSISATATTDASSAMNTLDGDATDSSSWTCSSGEVCDITFDLQATESLEQLRIAFSEASDTGGHLNVMVAGESGVFSTVRAGIGAGGRPLGADGLQTFGGVLALARYVKIEAVPANDGGSIVINEVEFRVGDVAPVRPVSEKMWLRPTGPLPLGYDANHDDTRTPSDGGCDSPAHFEGCHVYYMKDGDMNSRWTCGPLATAGGSFRFNNCDVDLSLNYYRYVRQIQIAFHMGDEQHDEFGIEAETAQGWVTVVASAITSGDTTDYQTFDVGVHAITLRLVPKFQRVNQWINVNEMVVLEQRDNAFLAGSVPVFDVRESFENSDVGSSNEIPTRFKFDIPSMGDRLEFRVEESTVTALRMRFPADREFVFDISYRKFSSSEGFEDVIERFTSAGGENEWETFTLSAPATIDGYFESIAVSGPTFTNVPGYPALRVIDFQVVGERADNGPGFFNMVTTAMAEWSLIPDIIGDGVSDQEDIMAAICETKGAAFDGTDCVGDLDDSTVHINLRTGDYFLDGPIFVKSGVTLQGAIRDDPPTKSSFTLYEGANNGNTEEDAIMVLDAVTDATVDTITFERAAQGTGDIVPGTVGNLCMDVRNSKDLQLDFITPDGCRNGAAHFTDSSNITIFALFDSTTLETGNFVELTRVDDFHVRSFSDMRGLLMDTCNNIVWDGYSSEGSLPSARLSPPTGGSQAASVVITGDSSGIVFRRCDVGPGPEPRILMESIIPLTLDNILEYEEASSGDCIVGVPEGSPDDLLTQLNLNEQALSKSGDCWVLD